MMPQAKGSSPAAMVPLLPRYGGPHACHPLALCRWVPKGSECQGSPAPHHPRQVRVSKAQRLVGREGRDSGEKEEGPCFSAYLDYDLSLSRRLVSTAVVDNFFLQLKPHIRPHDASQCNGEQLGLCSSEQSPRVKPSSPGAAAAVGGPELTVHSLLSLSCPK